jgi:hypothetical protein
MLVLAALPIVARGAPPSRSLTMTAKPNPVVYGRTTAISGRLVGDKAAGKNVTLRRDPFPFTGFGNAGSATASASGAYSFTQKPLVNTRFQTKQGKTESTVLTVLVRIRTSLRVSDSKPAAGQRVRFSGKACPKHNGTRVRIQRRRANKRWRTVARARLRDGKTCSVYRRRLRVLRDGTYRVVVPADADHARGTSRKRRLNVP